MDEAPVLICGASAGIGKETALFFSRAGHPLTLLSRNRERLESLSKELLKEGSPKVDCLVLDLEDLEGLKSTLSSYLSGLSAPIQVLVNNSSGPPSGLLLEARVEDFLKPFYRHLLASHLLVQLLLPGMEKAGWGRIVNVVSTSVREPIPGLGVSNTIRGAVASWSKTLAGELPPGITINNVLPGFTSTERLSQLKEMLAKKRGVSEEEVEQGWLSITPERRFADPSEIARAIYFLAEKNSGFIRGVSLPIDGGRLKSL